jgi:hypothetical protein
MESKRPPLPRHDAGALSPSFGQYPALTRRNFFGLATGLICAGASMSPAAYSATTSNMEPSFAPPASSAVRNLPRSTLSLLTGRRLQLRQVMQYLYDAGFVSEEPLVAGTAVAIAESELYVSARNWHPEKGYRPESDLITVKGPAAVWRDGCQLHSDRGIWQIASYWHSFYSDSETDDPARAAAIAFSLSGGGTDFNLWTSFSGGSAQKHFDRSFQGWPALRPLVRRFLAFQSSSTSGTESTTTDGNAGNPGSASP